MNYRRLSNALLSSCLLAGASISLSAQNFGSVAIGQSSTATISVPITTAGTVGSISVRLLGAENLDFTNAGGGTCRTGTAYAAKATCTVIVKFTPKYTGARNGAVVLFSEAGGAGAILANAPVYGVGEGPQIAFEQAPLSAITVEAEGLVTNYPTWVAVDGAGNIYVSDPNNARVVIVPADGGPGIALRPTADGVTLTTPQGVAIDGAGDILIVDSSNGHVFKIPPGSGAPTSTKPWVGTGALTEASGLAIDGAGDLFIGDGQSTGGDEGPNNRVIKVPADGGHGIVFSSSGAGPIWGVALDSAGDLFMAGYRTHSVLEYSPGGAYMGSFQPSANGIPIVDYPYGVAVDGAGDVFIADPSRIFELQSGGATSWTFPSGLLQIALDSAGNLYMTGASGYSNPKVFVSRRATPPPLTFKNTSLASTSADSPQTIQVQNIGNQPLIFTVVNYPTDFPETAGGASPCNYSAILSAGQLCDLTIEFHPETAGAHTEKVILDDNSLNVKATQSITVTGDSLPVPSVSLLSSANPSKVGSSVTFTVTVTGASPAPTGTVGFNANGQMIGQATLSAGQAAFTLASLPGGLDAITASYRGDGNYGPANSSSLGQVVNQITPAVSLVASPNPANSGEAITLTATVAGAGGVVPTGTVEFYADAVSLGIANLKSGVATLYDVTLALGKHSVTAQYNGDNSYFSVNSSPLAVTAGQVSTTVSVSAVPSPVALGSLLTVTASVATPPGGRSPSGVVVFYLDGTSLGPTTLANGAATYQSSSLPVGKHTFAARYNGDANYFVAISSLIAVSVTKAATFASLTASPNPVAVGASLTVTAIVATTLSGKAPTGTVKLYLDKEGIGVFTLVNGSVNYKTSSLAAGLHSLAAQYNGDPNYNGVDATPVTVTVTK